MNEEVGLYKIILDKYNNITDFEKIKYGILEHTSENANKYRGLLGSLNEFGVIICNITHLDKCIKSIFSVMEKMMVHMKKMLEEKTYLLGEEFLFNKRAVHQYLLFE